MRNFTDRFVSLDELFCSWWTRFTVLHSGAFTAVRSLASSPSDLDVLNLYARSEALAEQTEWLATSVNPGPQQDSKIQNCRC